MRDIVVNNLGCRQSKGSIINPYMGMRPKCDTSTDETLKIGKCQMNFVALRHEDPLVFDLVQFSQTTVKQPPSSYTAIRTMHGLVFGCPTHYTRGIQDVDIQNGSILKQLSLS